MHLPSTGLALLAQLEGLCPSLRGYWEHPANLFNAPEPSVHAVFAAFSHFVRERGLGASPALSPQVLAFLEACLSEPDSLPLSNAAATCFIENLAGEPCLERHVREFGPNSRRVHLAWRTASSS
jgi:hypothetical protein